MKKINIATIAGAIALVGGLAFLPTSPALAQKGSRLCGKIATGIGDYKDYNFGWLVGLRDDHSTYSSDCDFAIKYADLMVRKEGRDNWDWKTISKYKCEDVGKYFQNYRTPLDICDKMEAKSYTISLV